MPATLSPKRMCKPRVKRLRRKPRPICPEHSVLMNAYAKKGDLTYYKCQVPGCRESKGLNRVFIELDNEGGLQQ